jgi:hypothetical protein
MTADLASDHARFHHPARRYGQRHRLHHEPAHAALSCRGPGLSRA